MLSKLNIYSYILNKIAQISFNFGYILDILSFVLMVVLNGIITFVAHMKTAPHVSNPFIGWSMVGTRGWVEH